MPKVYINRIIIAGNNRTNSEVILRNCVSSHDPFNLKKIKRSEERLNNLGFFKNIKIKTFKKL